MSGSPSVCRRSVGNGDEPFARRLPWHALATVSGNTHFSDIDSGGAELVISRFETIPARRPRGCKGSLETPLTTSEGKLI